MNQPRSGASEYNEFKTRNHIKYFCLRETYLISVGKMDTDRNRKRPGMYCDAALYFRGAIFLNRVHHDFLYHL